MDPTRTASKGPRTPSTGGAPLGRVCTTLDQSSRPPNDHQTRRSDAFGEYCGLKERPDGQFDFGLHTNPRDTTHFTKITDTHAVEGVNDSM